MADPIYYASTMTGNETVAYTTGDYIRCFLDPNGADRTFAFTGVPDKFELALINVGNELVTFDPSGLAESVGAGEKKRFYQDGGSWR